MDDQFTRLAVALGIGLLIGLERGWRGREEAAGQRTAGIRTFAMTGLLGGVFGLLARAVPDGGGLLLGFGFAAYVAVLGYFYAEENRAAGIFSATAAVAAMVTFALGAYAVLGDIGLAVAAGVATASILALRERLHGWVARLTYAELRAGLLLTAMTFIALPVLPDHPIGPFGGIDLREIWIIAIVLAAVSFFGYVAVKSFGATRGILLGAAAGGLVSSTAVMTTNARRAAAGEGAPRLLAAAAMLATAISFLRGLVLVAAFNTAVFAHVAAPLTAAAAASIAAAWILARHAAASEDQAVRFHNPFEPGSVVGFALVLGVVLIVSRIASERFGEAGAVITALLAGLADVDAVTVSVTKLAPGTLTNEAAGRAVLAAFAANTFSKLVMGVLIGRGTFAVSIAVSIAAAAGAAIAALVATRSMML